VLQSIVEHELNAREKLLEADAGKLFDKVGRAYGILQNSHLLSSSEAMNLLSLIRLGIDLGFSRDTQPLGDRPPLDRGAARPSATCPEGRVRARAARLPARGAPAFGVCQFSPPGFRLSHHRQELIALDPRFTNMSQEPMNNFTPRAQQVLALARKEADRFHHNYVGTEHILLGLIKLGQGVAVSVLQKMGLDLETVRSAVEKQVGTGQETKTQAAFPTRPA
jgi:hypothetical protein